MEKKQVIRLTESDLHRIIKESVKKIVKESKYDGDFPYDYYYSDEGFLMDEDILEQLEDARHALSAIDSLIYSISNRFHNPRISKKATEMSNNIGNLISSLDPRSSFVKACILQAQNTWVNVGKKPQNMDRDTIFSRQAVYDINHGVGARKIYPKQPSPQP